MLLLRIVQMKEYSNVPPKILKKYKSMHISKIGQIQDITYVSKRLGRYRIFSPTLFYIQRSTIGSRTEGEQLRYYSADGNILLK
jgi:hypothetical protein